MRMAAILHDSEDEFEPRPDFSAGAFTTHKRANEGTYKYFQ